MDAYARFLAQKAIDDPMTGLTDIPDLPACLFPFQHDIVTWALRRGRAALFAGTGLGKSLMELSWAQAVHQSTGKDILHLAPLAVSNQMAREADKFGIAAKVVSTQSECGPGTNITNYQKLDHFDLSRFGGVILDESSILKSTNGHYRTALIEACQSIPFRLAATATPAPNDFMELGNHAEFLGVMKYTDMLATFFVHDGGSTQDWRLKGHAENEFWRWMATWAVMLRKPSDLGYANDGYDLPPLVYHQHTVDVEYAPSMETGFLFPIQAATLAERISARRDTVEDRIKEGFNIVIGSICAKLPEWHGNQNTQSAEGQNINPMPPSANAGNLKAEAPNGTQNICANTISSTALNSNEHRSNRRKSTDGGENGMPAMLLTGKNAKSKLESGLLPLDAQPVSKPNTVLPSQTTPPYSSDKAALAQSAAPNLESGSSWITAIEAAKSEGYFAAPATLASDISRMTQSGLIEPWCIWCNLNSEQDALAKLFGPLAYSVSGAMDDEAKETAIFNWISGERPIMISKPSMMGFGMNFQHCNNTMFVGLNDSFEQFYQAIRRFWRFGQTKPVNCHIIAAETEGATVSNIRRKEADADRMAAAMVMHMADLSSKLVRGQVRDVPTYNPQQPIKLPSFLEMAA